MRKISERGRDYLVQRLPFGLGEVLGLIVCLGPLLHDLKAITSLLCSVKSHVKSHVESSVKSHVKSHVKSPRASFSEAGFGDRPERLLFSKM